jgi:hypothetical protein
MHAIRINITGPSWRQHVAKTRAERAASRLDHQVGVLTQAVRFFTVRPPGDGALRSGRIPSTAAGTEVRSGRIPEHGRRNRKRA